MPVHYHCRHCAAKIGTIEGDSLQSVQLGLHHLTDQERQEMVSYGMNGDMNIKAICEDCHEAYMRNPDLHQYDYLIQ